jgi:hypothetical protein
MWHCGIVRAPPAVAFPTFKSGGKYRQIEQKFGGLPNFQPSLLDVRRLGALFSQINSQFGEFDKFWPIFGLFLKINVTVQQSKEII